MPAPTRPRLAALAVLTALAVLGTTAPAGAVLRSRDYTFLQVQADGRTPVTWTSCQPTLYKINPGGMSAREVRRLQIALSWLTGRELSGRLGCDLR